jgi:hypothetical protein
MKITKKMINEMVNEEFEKVNTTDASSASRALGTKGTRQGGISDQERGVITGLGARLADAAAKGNIASGVIARKIQMLVAELDNLAPEEVPEENI